MLAEGMTPDWVVGDFDSLSGDARKAFEQRLFHISEQDSTDFAKALRSFPAPLTIGVGFIGARSDHFLACLTELARSALPCLLLGEEECVCICPNSLTLDLAPGTNVSLWPLGSARGSSTGLRWPIDGLELGPTTRVGTSNEATGPITLTLTGAPVVLLVPADVLPELVKSMHAAPRPRPEASL